MSADKGANRWRGNMVDFVIGLECFGICLTMVALFLLLNGDGAKEQKLLILILCGSMVQNVGYLLELTAPTVDAAMAAVKVEKEQMLMFYTSLYLIGVNRLVFHNGAGFVFLPIEQVVTLKKPEKNMEYDMEDERRHIYMLDNTVVIEEKASGVKQVLEEEEHLRGFCWMKNTDKLLIGYETYISLYDLEKEAAVDAFTLDERFIGS